MWIKSEFASKRESQVAREMNGCRKEEKQEVANGGMKKLNNSQGVKRSLLESERRTEESGFVWEEMTCCWSMKCS